MKPCAGDGQCHPEQRGYKIGSIKRQDANLCLRCWWEVGKLVFCKFGFFHCKPHLLIHWSSSIFLCQPKRTTSFLIFLRKIPFKNWCSEQLMLRYANTFSLLFLNTHYTYRVLRKVVFWPKPQESRSLSNRMRSLCSFKSEGSNSLLSNICTVLSFRAGS